jgi:hypothetical protein
MEKEKIVELLKKEYWHPLIHPTNAEMEASQMYNSVLDRLIEKIQAL